MVLGRREITAIPELLRLLEIERWIVTIDAMGCQKEIAGTILDKGADYVLGLKGNQGSLHDDVKLYFEDCLASGFKGIAYDYHETIDGDHGRIETRRYWTASDIDWLAERHNWEGLSALVMVRRERYETGTEVHYSRVMPKKQPRRCEAIGVSRIVSTGCSILPFVRTSVVYGKITHRQTSRP